MGGSNSTAVRRVHSRLEKALLLETVGASRGNSRIGPVACARSSVALQQPYAKAHHPRRRVHQHAVHCPLQCHVHHLAQPLQPLLHLLAPSRSCSFASTSLSHMLAKSCWTSTIFFSTSMSLAWSRSGSTLKRSFWGKLGEGLFDECEDVDCLDPADNFEHRPHPGG
jgi:hypothetical protein